nr:hypothetical protein [Bifidobacterium bombi]
MLHATSAIEFNTVGLPVPSANLLVITDMHGKSFFISIYNK